LLVESILNRGKLKIENRLIQVTLANIRKRLYLIQFYKESPINKLKLASYIIRSEEKYDFTLLV
jgi:hypothetical protein